MFACTFTGLPTPTIVYMKFDNIAPRAYDIVKFSFFQGFLQKFWAEMKYQIFPWSTDHVFSVQPLTFLTELIGSLARYSLKVIINRVEKWTVWTGLKWGSFVLKFNIFFAQVLYYSHW